MQSKDIYFQGVTSQNLHGDTHQKWETNTTVKEVLEILALRDGHDCDGISAAHWAGDIQRESDFISDMNPQTFQLLLEIVCMLPDAHPLHQHLRNTLEGLLP
jgi:hypothetical protein